MIHPRRLLTVFAITAVITGALTAGGCSILTSPDREYDSNRRILTTIEARLRYKVDRERYRLTRAEVTDDAITLHYLGVKYPGDQAWVVRFSQKSTELSPERLATVKPAVAVIRDEGLQPGFAPSAARTATVVGVEIEAVPYTFHSTLAPSGRQGQGILAALRRIERGESVVYQIKLDNHGDRERLTTAALAPLLAPFTPR